MTSSILLSLLTLLPRLDAQGEITHELGTDDQIRGTIELALDLTALAGDGWRLDLTTALRTYVRDNRADESPVRISPRQIHYPISAHLRLERAPGERWGIFAAHQSNHDVDHDVVVDNRETLAFETYGLEYLWPDYRVSGALYYDRGTTRDGEAQVLPFQRYLAGVAGEGTWVSDGHGYVAGRLTTILDRESGPGIPHVRMLGAVDLGARWAGLRGDLRTFVRLERLESYRHLDDTPRHLVLFGISIGAR